MATIEASEIPMGEEVYLKKDWFGWRVVHPIKNKDGSFNWFNILCGSKSNLVFLVILLLVGLGLYIGINELLSNYKLIAQDPCSFCSDCHEQCRLVIDKMNVIPTMNIPKLNLTI